MWLTFKIKYAWEVKTIIEDEDDSLNISKICFISNKQHGIIQKWH